MRQSPFRFAYLPSRFRAYSYSALVTAGLGWVSVSSAEAAPVPVASSQAAPSGSVSAQVSASAAATPSVAPAVSPAAVTPAAVSSSPVAAPSQVAVAPSSVASSNAPSVPPSVTPPKLVYFVPAVFPKEAATPKAAAPTDGKAGDEATVASEAKAEGVEVTLKLLVQKDGTVGSTEILRSGGEAFDAAATAAVKQFVFTPALRAGQLVPTFIAYTYRFDQEAPVAGAEAAPDVPQAVALVGNFEGRVLILGTEAPLAGAKLSVQPAVGDARETVTDADGRFNVSDLLPGQYHVTLLAAGFSVIEADEGVYVGQATDATYRVAPETEGVEVVVRGERPPREVTRRTLERREIAKVPGTGGDALRSIQSLPGVARPPGLAGLLIVRGAAPQDTNTFIDGSLVPLIYHFGGLSSVVPTELLDRIDFYPGNFSAAYGRVSGGVVDVALRSPETGCLEAGVKSSTKKGCFHGLAQLDLIDGRVLFQGPIAKNWSFAVAGRRSWVDTWLKPVLEKTGAGVSSAPVYYDYQAIVEYKESSKRKLRLQFYGSDDSLELIIKNPAAEEPAFSGSLNFGTAFYRGQIAYEEQLTSTWNLRSSLSIGRDRIRFGIGPLKFELDSYPISLRTELGWKPIKGLKLNAGMDTLVGNFNVHVRAPEPGRPGEPDPGPFSTRPIFDTRSQGTSYRPAWYLEGEIQPTEKLLIVPGVRVDYARDSSHVDFSPRVSARYTLRGGTLDEQGNKVRKTALKGGFGYFFQPPQYQETDKVFGKPGLYSNRSLHIGLGIEQELTNQLEVSVEGYWKPLTRQVSRGPGPAGYVYNNEGRGRVLGIETQLKYKPDDRFFGWLAYTLSKSTRQSGPGQEEHLFQYDQTHILTLLGSYRLGDGWELGARFRLVSGNPYTPTSSSLPALYNADAGSYAPLQGKPFSKRLPLFHQLDVRVEKTWQFDAWRLQAYLDVWNAYNHAAVEDMLPNFNYTLSAPQSGLPIIPSIGLRGEF